MRIHAYYKPSIAKMINMVCLGFLIYPKVYMSTLSFLSSNLRMLQENPELFQLYKDLVISGVMSAEEFWASRRGVSKTSLFLQHVFSFVSFSSDFYNKFVMANDIYIKISIAFNEGKVQMRFNF